MMQIYGKFQTPSIRAEKKGNSGKNLPEKSTSKCSCSLDTLAQLDHPQSIQLENSDLENKEKLRKRRISKYISNEIIFPLIDYSKAQNLHDWKKKFWSTYHCTRILQQHDDGSITSKFCKQRWCVVCNRIRTGVLINSYHDILDNYDDLHFVTLTAPTVPGNLLSERISEMQTAFTNCIRAMRRKGVSVDGIRKLEVTYSKGKYHPHYHVIINTKKHAESLVYHWLKRNKSAYTRTTKKDAVKEAQDIKKITKNSLLELFKYATKMHKTGKKVDLDTSIRNYPPEAMLTIFDALKGRRIIQTFGSIRKVDDDFNPDKATVYLNESRQDLWTWLHEYKNWICEETGEERV